MLTGLFACTISVYPQTRNLSSRNSRTSAAHLPPSHGLLLLVRLVLGSLLRARLSSNELLAALLQALFALLALGLDLLTASLSLGVELGGTSRLHLALVDVLHQHTLVLRCEDNDGWGQKRWVKFQEWLSSGAT